MGAPVERLSFSERGSAVWEAFQTGKAYAEALAKEPLVARADKPQEGEEEPK
jgi:hypothetical protein